MRLLGHCFGLSAFSKLLPYLNLTENYEDFFKKDPGFSIKNIVDNYGGEEKLKNFIESMKA